MSDSVPQEVQTPDSVSDVTAEAGSWARRVLRKRVTQSGNPKAGVVPLLEQVRLLVPRSRPTLAGCVSRQLVIQAVAQDNLEPAEGLMPGSAQLRIPAVERHGVTEVTGDGYVGREASWCDPPFAPEDRSLPS
jgi:hypothetical protein